MMVSAEHKVLFSTSCPHKVEPRIQERTLTHAKLDCRLNICIPLIADPNAVRKELLG